MLKICEILLQSQCSAVMQNVLWMFHNLSNIYDLWKNVTNGMMFVITMKNKVIFLVL